MEHDLELIIARLEILEIEVCDVLQNPGNIGNRSFSIFWTPGNIGNLFFPIFRISWKYWKYDCSRFLTFLQKKTRAEISRRMHRSMGRDLSYETDSGPKTKTVSDLNFQLTATAAAATATTSQQLSHLARALDHHAQGPNIPFGVIPHFDISLYKLRLFTSIGLISAA